MIKLIILKAGKLIEVSLKLIQIKLYPIGFSQVCLFDKTCLEIG